MECVFQISSEEYQTCFLQFQYIDCYYYYWQMRTSHIGKLLRWILPKELPIWSTVYNCTFLKKINSDGFFYVPEHCQHHLFYWLLCLKLFFYRKVSMFPLHGLLFSTQACCDKSMFNHKLKQENVYLFPCPWGNNNYVDAYFQSSWEDMAKDVTMSSIKSTDITYKIHPG